MLGSLGASEIGIILLIVVILFGAKRLPELGRGIGDGLREFRGAFRKLHEEDDE